MCPCLVVSVVRLMRTATNRGLALLGLKEYTIGFCFAVHFQYWLREHVWAFEKVLYIGSSSGCGSG